MKKIGYWLTLILIFPLIIIGQEYKQPTQQYYQPKDTEYNKYSDAALIVGNIFFITLAANVDRKMSHYGKNQHTNLIISSILCVGIDYFYVRDIVRKNKKVDKESRIQKRRRKRFDKKLEKKRLREDRNKEGKILIKTRSKF